MVVNIEVMALICCDFSVESHQKRFEDAFSSLQVEIHDSHPIEKGDQRVFGDPVEINLKISEKLVLVRDP